MLMDFNRLNSRMHNKLFIVDNMAMITGGRNVGSNYFMPETASNFADTDVLFIGKIANDATASFNEYWNHHLAVPAYVIPKACSRHALKKLDKQFQKLAHVSAINIRKYNTIISLAIREYKMKNFDFSWGQGKFIADPPSKVEIPLAQKEKYRDKILIALNRLWRQTEKSVYVSAAYFVPGRGGMDMIRNEKKSDVHVTIVTNSLASTNAPTVYGKWEKYRKELIQMGVDVYEFMTAAESKRGKIPYLTRKKLRFSVMHSKNIVFDDKISWIGSFNLDPRSAYFNTENVAIFESAEFAARLRNMIVSNTQTSWNIKIKNGRTIWTGMRPGDTHTRVYHHCPDTTILRRTFKFITKVVPEKFV